MKRILLALFVLVIAPAMAIAADPAKARVVTFRSNVVKCLAPVAITQIDGRLRQLPSMGFELEPGLHTMHGSVTVDTRNCPVAQAESRRPVHIPPLDWYFEPGKVYYVAFDHSASNRKNWRLVVWKVEYEDGELIFDITAKTPELPH